MLGTRRTRRRERYAFPVERRTRRWRPPSAASACGSPPTCDPFTGSTTGSGGRSLLHYGEFFSLAQVVAGWDAHRSLERSQRSRIEGGGWAPLEMAGPIRPVWWSTRRVFVTGIGGADGVMADLDPAAGGTVGQLIEFDHEVGPRCVLAPSFTAWLERIATGLAHIIHQYRRRSASSAAVVQ